MRLYFIFHVKHFVLLYIVQYKYLLITEDEVEAGGFRKTLLIRPFVPRWPCWSSGGGQTAGGPSRPRPEFCSIHIEPKQQQQQQQLGRRSARSAGKRRRCGWGRGFHLWQEVAVQPSAEQKQRDVLQPGGPGPDAAPDLRVHPGKPVQTQRHGWLWHLLLLKTQTHRWDSDFRRRLYFILNKWLAASRWTKLYKPLSQPVGYFRNDFTLFIPLGPDAECLIILMPC